VALAALSYLHCAWLLLRRGRGTPLPFAPPREFVAEGPYRYTRNPMALSVVSGIAGASLALGSIPGLASALLVAFALHLYITRREEPALARRFGGSYAAYRERVPRWLPRIPRDARADG
jgi:protein-S-isoprenylcysteine O-methyltransferase Ste14